MMDNYVEQIVPSKAKGALLIPVVLTYVLLFLGMGLMFLGIAQLGLPLLIIDVVVFIISTHNLKIEYEYIFTNGDLDIARIKNKASRKAVYSLPEGEVQRILSYQGEKFQNEKSLGRFKIRDFTSMREKRADMWYAFFNKDGVVLLELNEKSLEYVKSVFKKKVEQG